MSATTTTTGIPRAKQKRSKETLRRILDAFESALDEKTFEEVTVGELCRDAGCSVGTFYGRVESKEALLDHLRERVYGDVDAELARLFSPERSSSQRLADVIAEQLGALLRFHQERRGVIRAVIVQARRQRAFAEHTKSFNAEVLRRAVGSWLIHRSEIVHDDPVAAIEHAVLMAAGYLRESIVFAELWPSQSNNNVDSEQRLRTLYAMVAGYLCGSPQHQRTKTS